MANTTNLNIRVDEELKRKAEAIFAELGLNMRHTRSRLPRLIR